MTAGAVTLAELAEACGVATTYRDYRQRAVTVNQESVRLVLEAMGVPAGDEKAVTASLTALRERDAARLLPPSPVVRSDQAATLPARGRISDAEVVLADGQRRALAPTDGLLRLPAGLPTGYHRLAADVAGRRVEVDLVVAPARCPLPPLRRGWAWMLQLYQARSRKSWGMGDYADLGTLAAWAGRLGADAVVVNPLHAATPGLPQTDSPYYPSSRRYRSPLYLRVEDLPEYAALSGEERATVEALALQARAGAADRIHRDRVFTAKDAAMRLLAAVPRAPARQAAYDAWRQAEGGGVVDFATFCALAEVHGRPWQRWPAPLRHPASPAVVRARAQLADRVEHHVWLQWLCDTQLEAAAAAASAAGMAVGIVHDLAVGVDPGGADAWALQDDLAGAATVGAPPDGFNQQGQDWRLPPLLPGRLRDTAYAPFRDMLRSVLRHAGGLRVDHVMGLWRLWWVPEGLAPSRGAYVRYPAEDLLGVLALEAERAGALVIGEDLGTVEPTVRSGLAQRGVLSSRVLYFEHVDDHPDQPRRPAAEYPRLTLTSITTHDLPTAPGWWADEDVRVQTALGLFAATTTPAAEAARKAAERASMLALLRTEGLVGEQPDEAQLVAAMHAFLARTPSLLVAASLADALGDRCQPNLPGTTDEYPNWRLPLARWTAAGRQPVELEDVADDPGVLRVAALLSDRPD